jgi:uncharacterized protein
MRFAVFGGTGRVGHRLIEYATQAGHTVRALVRDPAKLASMPRLQVASGDVADANAVLAALEGADAVLSSLGGAGLANPGMTLSQGMRNIVRAMRQVGSHRVLAVAGSGVLDDRGGGLRADAADFPAIYQPITREHRGTWEALRETDLDWTLVCCPDLVEGALTRRYRVAVDVLPEGGNSISVEDVAEFMLGEAAGGTYLGRRVGLAY